MITQVSGLGLGSQGGFSFTYYVPCKFSGSGLRSNEMLLRIGWVSGYSTTILRVVNGVKVVHFVSTG